jgi:enoyl reductase-like protein
MLFSGGRGGGHHSFEDFHQPILITYKEIRKAVHMLFFALLLAIELNSS